MERLTMTVPEFCELTGISKQLGYSLAREDRLPVKVIRLGRRMVLSRAAVEALLSASGSYNPGNEGQHNG